MNQLQSALCYLSGPIDFAADDGRSWRKELKERISYLGIKCLDPTNKPHPMDSEVGWEKDKCKKLKAERQFDELRVFAKKIRRQDLRMIDYCDFVIAYIDTDIFMFGTVDEIITAERQKKPVLGIFPRGLTKAPLWAFAIFKQEEMFESLQECVTYLNQLDSSSGLDPRWLIIRQELNV